MCVRIPFCTFSIIVAIGLLSGATNHLQADDLALNAATEKSAATEAKPVASKEEADKGDVDKDAKKTSEKEEADDAASSGLDALALIRELNSLRIKRAKYAQNLGPGHPTIVDLNEQIKEVESKIGKAPKPNDPLTKKVDEIEEISEKELRNTVGMLIKRVRDLEYDLTEMKRDMNAIRQRR